MSIIIVLLLAGFVFYPGKSTNEQIAPLKNRWYAHRGLHTPDKTIPENSMKAFKRAVAMGYGIELDVQLSKDEQVIVFHDAELKRMTGVCKKVEQCTWNEMSAFRLCKTEEKIPLFEEVLAEIDGRVPIIVELKRGKRNTILCEKVAMHLKNYNGSICVESFDPRIVRWFRKNEPHILRGQLTQSYQQYKKDGVNAIGAFLLSRCFGNFIARPQFVAWGQGRKNIMVKAIERAGGLKVFWTAQDAESHAALKEQYDAIIFEYSEPQF